jgi:hypothetical protein
MASRQQMQHMAHGVHATATRQYLLLHGLLPGNPEVEEDKLYVMSKEQAGLHWQQQQLQCSFEYDLQQLLSQKEQQGPPPLWQQALLQVVVQQAAVLRNSSSTPPPGQPFPRWAGLPEPQLAMQCGVLPAVLHGLQAGRSAQVVQGFTINRLFQHMPQQGPSTADYHEWTPHTGFLLLHRAPQLTGLLLRSGMRCRFVGRAHTCCAP